MTKWMHWGKVSLLASSALFVGSITGCEEAKDAANDVGEQCNLTCSAEGVVDGNASISGVAKVDAFFAAVVNFNTAANRISSGIEAQLARIRASLELDADATPAEIVAAIETQFQLQGGIKVVYRPAECAVSARATVEAQARCEGTVTPPMASVECKGTCEVDASVEASCDAQATVKCVGTAPELNCNGSCEGACEIETTATCEGTCRGTCDGECSATNAEGECAGTCTGKCEGTCEFTAHGECTGKCKGECEYTPPSGECEADASVRCEAKANGSVQCNGRCQGEITPPMASAECQASAKAEAKVNVECTPPQLDIQYAFRANANADVRARFEAFLVRFRGSLSAIAVELGRSDLVLEAGADLVAAANVAVKASVQASLDGDLSFKETIGLGCAIDELPEVQKSVNAATTKLNGSVGAATDLTNKLAGG